MGSSASIEQLKKQDDSSPPTFLLNRDRRTSSMGFISSSFAQGLNSGNVRTDDVRHYKLTN